MHSSRSCAIACAAELVDLVPDLTDDLLNTVDQPLQLAKDGKGNAYLLCDYNRDGDSYRSPWTNQYDPPLDDGVLPSTSLRNMEILANDIFDGYREMYYEGGAVSVYFWDLDEPAFAACVLFKKGAPRPAPRGSTALCPASRTAHSRVATRREPLPLCCPCVAADVETKIKGLNAGNWDAIHVVEVKPGAGGKADYKLTSTIMLRVAVDHNVKGAGAGALNLSGSLTRQREQTMNAVDPQAREPPYPHTPPPPAPRPTPPSLALSARAAGARRRTWPTWAGWSRRWRTRCATRCRRSTLARPRRWSTGCTRRPERRRSRRSARCRCSCKPRWRSECRVSAAV